MPVISPHKLWPYSRVPYVAQTPEIESWLLEINSAIGFPLLVSKGISDVDYIAASTGSGKSESIGYVKNVGKYTITASKKFSMQHELMHALGFHHEQLHKGGPWGAFATKASSAEKIDKELLKIWGANMLPEGSKPKASESPTLAKTASTTDGIAKKTSDGETHKRRMSIGGGEKLVMDINKEAIEQHKRAYKEAIEDNNIEHWKSCDFDSVMMYGEMRKAVESLPAFKDKAIGSKKHPKAECLSNLDVQALQTFYKCTIISLYVPPPV
jgi:hypothetical protein